MILGGKQLLAISFSCIIAAGLLSLLRENANTISIGASGILYGYLTSLLVLSKGKISAYIPSSYTLQLSVILVIIFIEIITQIIFNSNKTDWLAHLGGALTGVIYTYIYSRFFWGNTNRL